MTKDRKNNDGALSALGEQMVKLGFSLRENESAESDEAWKIDNASRKQQKRKKRGGKRRKLTAEEIARKEAETAHKKKWDRIVAKASRDAQKARQKKTPTENLSSLEPRTTKRDPSIGEIEASIEALLPAVAERNRADHGTITASDADQEILNRRLECGGWEEVRTSMFEGEAQVYLGFDFGTTSSKLVFDLPYDGRFPRFAVSAPPALQAEGHPYLWKSCLWISEDGTYSLLPETRSRCLAGFKIELMKALAKTRPQGRITEPELTTTAYFTLMLRQALGWLHEEIGQIWKEGSVEYFVNYGFPASTVDSPLAAQGFKRCARAALQLVQGGTEINRHSVASCLRELEHEVDREDDWGIFPEITAAVAGFANSVKRRDGLYMLVDIGGMTVDCCTFNLYRAHKGKDRCPIFSADIRNLGVEPLKVWLERGRSEAEYRKVIWHRVTGIVGHTFKSRNPRSDRWGNELETFVTGGGAASSPHKTALEEVSKETQREDWCRTPLNLMPLPVENVEAPGIDEDDAQRLVVAIGLARPIDDIPEWVSESSIPDIERFPRSNYEEAYVGPEQV